ncbi:MAG: S8 family serine peptidase [Candidatus Kerfeldbacteria bacterium]|nr:S8 family serine peptidase [Candidatus Kerfeldbacteria bacterium]
MWKHFVFVTLASFGWFLASAAQAETVPGEYLVTLRPDKGAMVAENRLSYPRGLRIERTLPFNQNVVMVRAEGVKEERFLAAWRSDSRVVAIQPNYRYRALFTPNDPSFIYQWNFQAVHAPAAWDFDGNVPLYGGDPSVVVAVLDTGVAFEEYLAFHQAPDLAATTFVAGTDIINNDAHPNDDHGHGTHVAGTIAESTNNSLGAAGLAFASSLMPIKVLDANGFGTTANIASGIDFARTNGADIINLSLGGTDDDPILHTAVQQAAAAGIVVVAAAGNDGKDSLYYPAKYDEAMAVGAVRYDSMIAPYSNYGTGLDLVAPGGDLDVDQNGDGQADGILQQTCAPSSSCATFADYYYEGTSQATPHVSAAAALLLAAGITPANVRTILEGTAADLGTAGYDTTYGYGLLDINAALSIGLNDTTPPQGSVAINGGAVYTNSPTVTLTLSATDVGSAVTSMSFSNDGTTFSSWQNYATSTSWDLTTAGGTSANGAKVVSARFRDAAGNVSSLATGAILLDSTPPDAPVIRAHAPSPYTKANLRSGVPTSVHSLVAEWDEVTDNLSGTAGYRVALSPNSEPDLNSLSIQTDRLFTSQRFDTGRTLYLHVGAVDQAGNTSVSTFTFVYQPLRVATGTESEDGQVTILKLNSRVEQRLKPFGKTYRQGLQVSPITFRKNTNNDVLVAPGQGRPAILVIDDKGKLLLSFKPYGSRPPPGMNVTAEDLDGDGQDEIIVAPQQGKFPIEVFTVSGKLRRKFWPFGASYGGGVAVAAGVTEADGSTRIIAAKASGSPSIRIFDQNGQRQRAFNAFPASFTFGLAIAAGDVNGDGLEEIIVGPDRGGPQVRIFSGRGSLIRQFFAFDKNLRDGVRLATGDRDGDGKDEIFVALAGGLPQIRIFNNRARRLASFFGTSKDFRGGLNVATLR